MLSKNRYTGVTRSGSKGYVITRLAIRLARCGGHTHTHTHAQTHIHARMYKRTHTHACTNEQTDRPTRTYTHLHTLSFVILICEIVLYLSHKPTFLIGRVMSWYYPYLILTLNLTLIRLKTRKIFVKAFLYFWILKIIFGNYFFIPFGNILFLFLGNALWDRSHNAPMLPWQLSF